MQPADGLRKSAGKLASLDDKLLWKLAAMTTSSIRWTSTMGFWHTYLSRPQIGIKPISKEEENRLRELGLLGDLNAQTLLDTLIWMCALNFALRSGVEHQNICPDQSKLFESPGSKITQKD